MMSRTAQELERENSTLKRLLADAELEKAALKEIARGKLLSPRTPAAIGRRATGHARTAQWVPEHVGARDYETSKLRPSRRRSNRRLKPPMNAGKVRYNTMPATDPLLRSTTRRLADS